METTKKRKSKAGDPSKVVGYCRVSTGSQDLGIDGQKAALVAYCAAKNLELVAVYEDRGVSGAAPVDQSPGLLDALNALRVHGAGVLLASKRDRFHRDIFRGAVIQRTATENGALVLTTAGEGGEGADPTSQLLRHILDAFSAYERSQIALRTKTALAVKKARGERVSSSIPLGLRLLEGGRLAKDADEQHLASRCREMKDAGMTLAAIASSLNEQGVQLRGSKFHAVRVHRLLKAAA